MAAKPCTNASMSSFAVLCVDVQSTVNRLRDSTTGSNVPVDVSSYDVTRVDRPTGTTFTPRTVSQVGTLMFTTFECWYVCASSSSRDSCTINAVNDAAYE